MRARQRGARRCAGAGEPRDADAASSLALSLKNETAAAGFSPDLKPFRAHVTVARKVARAPAALALQPVLWRFDAFALIESRTDCQPAPYTVLLNRIYWLRPKKHTHAAETKPPPRTCRRIFVG